MTAFVSPNSLDEALELKSNGAFQILAGGTDIYPAHVGRPINQPLIDVARIASMKEVGRVDNYWRIGGGVSWREIIDANLPTAFDGLKLAAREIGAKQIQNVATIAGNLCNASPAADGVPPLLTLDAEVELTSQKQTRQLTLSDFILGNRQTAINADEILTAILIPDNKDSARSYFQKLGSRSYLVISIVMIACLLDVDDEDIVKSARISVGACSVVAKRLHALEAALVGLKAKDIKADARAYIKYRHFSNLSPIDDVRASGEYRLKAAQEMVVRSLSFCGGDKI